MNTNGHYTLRRDRNGFNIVALVCVHCHFEVRPVRRSGDRSGLGRYNRARASMVRHLHAEHTLKLREQKDPPSGCRS